MIDRHPEVLWWYQNKVGQENFAIQGFRKNRIFPDFVVQNSKDEKPVARVVVVESKGKHLGGNPTQNTNRRSPATFPRWANRCRGRNWARALTNISSVFKFWTRGFTKTGGVN